MEAFVLERKALSPIFLFCFHLAMARAERDNSGDGGGAYHDGDGYNHNGKCSDADNVMASKTYLKVSRKGGTRHYMICEYVQVGTLAHLN